MFKKKATWFIIAVIILIVGGVIYSKSRSPKIEYTTENVRKGDLARTVSATGTLKSRQEADLAFETSGRVSKVYVKVGSQVKKGQVLSVLDQREAVSSVRQYQSELKIQEDALLLKRRHWDDYKPEERASFKETVEKSRAALDGAKQTLRKTVLVSSMDGIVTDINFEEGENAVVNSAAITVIKGGDFEVEVDVAESDIVEVATSQKVKMNFDAFSSDEYFYGKVREIEPGSTVIQDVVYYKVKVALDELDERLKRGMSADVDIETAEESNVLIVPSRAIKNDGNRKYVEILNSENVPEKAYIETGLSGDDGLTAVKSGVKVDQKVITFTKK